jgi:hypothetical protein
MFRFALVMFNGVVWVNHDSPPLCRLSFHWAGIDLPDEAFIHDFPDYLQQKSFGTRFLQVPASAMML